MGLWAAAATITQKKKPALGGGQADILCWTRPKGKKAQPAREFYGSFFLSTQPATPQTTS